MANQSFFHELKRRNVLRVGGAYLLAALGLSAGVTELVDLFDQPKALAQGFTIVAILGFPIAMLIAWRYEITPEGVVTDAEAVSQDADLTTVILKGDAPQIHVSWADDDGTQRHAVFDGEFAIGRDPSCEIRINNPAVSRRHARVWQLQKQWIVEDLGSQNGTLVNGERIEKRALTNEENELMLSEHGPQLRLVVPDTAPAAEATMVIDADTVAKLRG